MNIELMKNNLYESKLRCYERYKEKFFKVRNNLNLIRFSNRSGCHINCFRFNLSESREHILKKLDVCIDLLKKKHKFITEAVFIDGGRADVFDLTEGTIYEIMNSESDKEFKEKVKKYPEEIGVVKVGV